MSSVFLLVNRGYSVAAMFAKISVAVAVCIVGWVYVAFFRPPSSKICGSPGGPIVSSPRIRLGDGRHVAYKEVGIPKQVAKYKIVLIHGWNTWKGVDLPFSQELIEELQIYFLLYDRPGYGDSDPYPSRSVKSEALDIEEIADKLQIGDKFYVLGMSLGAYPIWGCLKYIPQRLLGAALVVPMVNYWWPCLPPNLSRQAFRMLPMQYHWVFRIAYYTPWLLYFWMTQNMFPGFSILSDDLPIHCKEDLEILKRQSENPCAGQEKMKQQGDYESIHRDILVACGKWEFNPIDIPPVDGSIHIFQGREDKFVFPELNRYLSERLPWIQYHDVPNAGHHMIFSCFELICRGFLES